jgi:hypothetical protein
MKFLKSMLMLVVISALIVSAGCSKKDSPTSPPPQQNQLSAAQQPVVADMGQNMALSVDGNINTVQGYMDGMPKSVTKAPPSGWYGPDGSGWYSWYYGGVDTMVYTYKYLVRFTPDVWGGGTPPVTKVEWKWLYRDTTTYHFWYYASCENQSATDTTHVKGIWEYHVSNVYGGYNLGYVWSMNYDNVSKASNDYSGHYTYNFSYPTYGTSGVVIVTLAGAFTFNADGTGTGTMSAGGTEIVRYTFYAHDASPRGYYTLASENWGTQHPFSK